jgi:mono/diheme cytochrome c family protein
MRRVEGNAPRLAATAGLLLAAAAWVAVGCGESYPPTAEGIYMAKCSRCHEADGSSATASDLASATIDLRGEFFQKNTTDGEIRTIIQRGVGRMQGVPNLTDAEVDSLVLQVRRLGSASRP